MIWSSLHTKIVLAIAGLGLGALAVSGYVRERERAVRAETVQQAQATVIKQAQDDRMQHVKDDAARVAETDALVATLQKTIANLKTPQQQVAWSQDALKDALEGITITLDSKGQAIATIPAAAVPQLPQVIEQCKECELRLTTAQQNITSRDEQMKLADQQIQALKIDRDSWKVAAHGGTWKQRTVKAAKHGIIGGGIAIAILCSLGHCRL